MGNIKFNLELKRKEYAQIIGNLEALKAEREKLAHERSTFATPVDYLKTINFINGKIAQLQKFSSSSTENRFYWHIASERTFIYEELIKQDPKNSGQYISWLSNTLQDLFKCTVHLKQEVTFLENTMDKYYHYKKTIFNSNIYLKTSASQFLENYLQFHTSTKKPIENTSLYIDLAKDGLDLLSNSSKTYDNLKKSFLLHHLSFLYFSRIANKKFNSQDLFDMVNYAVCALKTLYAADNNDVQYGNTINKKIISLKEWLNITILTLSSSASKSEHELVYHTLYHDWKKNSDATDPLFMLTRKNTILFLNNLGFFYTKQTSHLMAIGVLQQSYTYLKKWKENLEEDYLSIEKSINHLLYMPYCRQGIIYAKNQQIYQANDYFQSALTCIEKTEYRRFMEIYEKLAEISTHPSLSSQYKINDTKYYLFFALRYTILTACETGVDVISYLTPTDAIWNIFDLISSLRKLSRENFFESLSTSTDPYSLEAFPGCSRHINAKLVLQGTELYELQILSPNSQINILPVTLKEKPSGKRKVPEPPHSDDFLPNKKTLSTVSTNQKHNQCTDDFKDISDKENFPAFSESNFEDISENEFENISEDEDHIEKKATPPKKQQHFTY